MSNFIEIDPTTLQNNPFQMLGRDWALVTVSDPDTGKVNTMTVSWGAMGVLWGKNTVTIYIRPQRYTHQFLEKTGHFTLSFYDGMRDALTLCGRTSGRDGDKIAAAGLHLQSSAAFCRVKACLLLQHPLPLGLRPREDGGWHRRKELPGPGLPRRLCGRDRKDAGEGGLMPASPSSTGIPSRRNGTVPSCRIISGESRLFPPDGHRPSKRAG